MFLNSDENPGTPKSVVRNKGNYSATTLEGDTLPTSAWDMLDLKLFILMGKEIGIIEDNYLTNSYPLTIVRFEFREDLFRNNFS